MPDKFDEVAIEIDDLYGTSRVPTSEVAAILRRHFGQASPEPLDKPDRVGWWECRYVNESGHCVRYWNGEFLSLSDDMRAECIKRLEWYTDFRPLVYAGESEQPTTEARP